MDQDSSNKPDWSKVKLVAFDFDGVFTDGFAYVDQNGVESIRVSRKDGLGIEFLNQKNLAMIVISREKNPVVAKRCEKLNLPVLSGIKDKLTAFKDFIEEKDISPDLTCYMGDDIIDIECIDFAGIGIALNDSPDEVKKVANYVTKRNGGEHAVREVCDLILKNAN